MLEIIDADTFAQKRRESLLDYAHYQERFLRIEEGYRITEAAAARSPEIIKSIPIYAISVSRKRRAWNTLFQLSIIYSHLVIHKSDPAKRNREKLLTINYLPQPL